VKESKVGTYVCKYVSRESHNCITIVCVCYIKIFKAFGSIRLIKAIPMELKIVSLN
jgi:hypothetical protein